MTRIVLSLLGSSLGLVPGAAFAANVLFVSDVATDTNIPGILMADGHTVTVVTNDFVTGDNPRLRGDLSGFQAIVWSATGSGGAGSEHTNAEVFTNLTAFVTGGGSVFVTGYDSIASPLDPRLVAFVGGAGSIDVPSAVGVCTMAENALTVGVVDIRGVTPTGGNGDRDALTSLSPETISVCPTTGGASHQFTLRPLGSGRIAYVSNGASGPTSTHASWATTTSGGAGAYNGALRNFIDNAAAPVLVVSDAATDTNIAGVLSAEGADVVQVVNDYSGGTNPTLAGSLARYAAVVWSASGDGAGGVHDDPAVFANLLAFATDGGHVLVVGHDALTNPTDGDLIAFLGGTDAVDLPADPVAVAPVRTILTVGAVDLRGVTPIGGSADRDALTGLVAGTEAVVSSAGTPAALWTVRAVGAGTISFIANGDPGPESAASSWTDTSGGGAGAYNAALRNLYYALTAGLPAIRANGSTCRRGIECVSDFCIDGVCCATRCGDGSTEDCQACAINAGGLANGTCGALTAAAASRVVCRPPTGGCDFPETCVSSSATCPADGLRASGFECRPQIGPCDVPDRCDGTSRDCPADAVAGAGESCRGASGDCDVPESCDGTSPACPPNEFVGSGTECRGSRGECDAVERCDGIAGECPPDRFAGGDVECRAAASPCDAPEMCDGVSLECAGDVDRPDGVSCDDATICNGVDVCVAGACVSRGSPCDDGDACTADMCSEAGGCTSVRIEDCCYDSSACDDGDPCTRDECTREHVCVHDVASICSDAGIPGDGGLTADAGARDAGRGPPVDEGCDCSTSGGPQAMSFLLVAVVAFLRRRRR
jgi:uncharacterized protein (TIGR03382 family)